MSYTESSNLDASQSASIRSFAVRGTFIAVICSSAFLLFLIQPMFSKMAVPLVGGSPGVWTTAMLFFQSILLAGYAYAHWLASSFPISRQRQIHMTVTVLAMLTLPLALPMGWALPSDGTVTVWLLALFTVSIGAPFFALSANSPLLQQWYAASGEPDGADPYFLYAASNIGSFGALVAYPLLIEPSIGLSHQGMMWSLGYVVLAAGIAVAGFMAHDGPATVAEDAVAPQTVAPLSRRQVGTWMLLAFVPSSMMLSVTAKIATDIGSFPLIWVTTLGLYLLTYVFAFSGSFRARAAWLPWVHMVFAIVMVAFVAVDKNSEQGMFEIGLVLGFLFVTALAFHTRLAESRPDKLHLTAFFLCMSAGGALGGVFNSILAPVLFDNVHEFTVVLVLAFIAAPKGPISWRTDIVAAVAVGLGVYVVILMGGIPTLSAALPQMPTILFVLAIGIGCLALLYWRRLPVRQMVLATCIFGTIGLLNTHSTNVMRERSFFGVYEVRDFPEDGYRTLQHGTTVHGMMLTDTPLPEPALYYARSTPFGQFFKMVDAGSTVGVVGLGSGGLACHRPGEVSKVFYEIDPLVDRIARDTTYFSMIAECAPDAPTLLGDARIELANAPAGSHDHLVLDAFSSDAIPVHLLTEEAFDVYDHVLPKTGSVFIHISNRHFDLEGPITRLAESRGFTVFHQAYVPTETEKNDLHAGSVVALVLTRDDGMIARLSQDMQWRTAKAWDGPIWTDDYANTMSAWK